MSKFPQALANFCWAILALVSMSHIFGAGAQYSINTPAPFYQDDLGLSCAHVGLFFTAFFPGMTGVSFLEGAVSPLREAGRSSLCRSAGVDNSI
jgi:hypothetical protein